MGLGHSPRIVTDGLLVLCLDAANKKSYGGSGATWTELSGRGMTYFKRCHIYRKWWCVLF